MSGRRGWTRRSDVGRALVEPPPFARRQLGVQRVVHQRVREPERMARVAGLAEQARSRRQIDGAGDGLGVEVRHPGQHVLGEVRAEDGRGSEHLDR